MFIWILMIMILGLCIYIYYHEKRRKEAKIPFSSRLKQETYKKKDIKESTI